MSSSPAAAPTRARSVNGPLPQLLVWPGRLASPDVADPSPAAPRWLRLVPVQALTAPRCLSPLLSGRPWRCASHCNVSRAAR
jgi:hypothetical protein